MNNHQFFTLLRAKFGTMVFWGFLFSAVSFLGLMAFTKPFQASMDFFIVQTGEQSHDFYAQFKSSEYLSKMLSRAVFSERFINAVVETRKAHSEFLPFDKKERLKAWSKMVSVQKNLELGILSVTVKGQRERDAARVMDAVAEVLTQKNSLFRGGDEKSVEIRVLSGPINEQHPTLGEILLTIFSGFVSGFFLAGFWLAVCDKNYFSQNNFPRAVSLEHILNARADEN
jgi:capsular polysaccharide biosynthesis protein